MGSNMGTVKPCPFCGGNPVFFFSGRQSDDVWKGAIVLKCHCGVAAFGGLYQGPPIEIPLEETVGGEKARIIWNRRTKNET